MEKFRKWIKIFEKCQNFATKVHLNLRSKMILILNFDLEIKNLNLRSKIFFSSKMILRSTLNIQSKWSWDQKFELKIINDLKNKAETNIFLKNKVENETTIVNALNFSLIFTIL